MTTLRSERGQALIWMALVFIILLGFVALAVDFGHIYSERRHMQNAADAAALEAARARCFTSASSSAAASAGIAYAKAPHNFAQDATVTTTDGWTFKAKAWTDAETYFARAFGVDTVRVEAAASATCGNTNAACGVFPIAFSLIKWNGIAGTCNKMFYVWSSDKEADSAPACDVCDCNVDGVEGDEVFTDAARGWLDFTGALDPSYPASCGASNGCGANELKCWVESYNPSRIVLPQCISGDSGVKAGVHNAIDDRAALPYPDNIVRVPLFTGTCTSDSNHCGKTGYYVTKFGCAQVGGWEQKLELPYKDKKNKKVCWKGKAVKMYVSCDPWCNTGCGVVNGEPPAEGGVRTIGLTN